MGDCKPSVKLDVVGAGLDDHWIASCCCLQLPRLLNELVNVEHVIWSKTVKCVFTRMNKKVGHRCICRY